MIEFLFTLDYEIYGNGTGSLQDLVYEPGRRLHDLFLKRNARFVNFVEVSELEIIEAAGTDAGIDRVKSQVNELYKEGFEIALHLHPQWYNAHYENGRWVLDWSENNLCTLSRQRIAHIVNRSTRYLRSLINDSSFSPISFRAGNWLFQPTRIAAEFLGELGYRIDSSVFKGGLQHNQTLDYRPSLKNGYFWNFSEDVNKVDARGAWIEVPIYTEMVPPWRMATSKRLGSNNAMGTAGRSVDYKFKRALDLLRFRYPLKLDFCHMTLAELTGMVERIRREDQKEPEVYKPVVAIGHTKDLSDPKTVDDFLAYLNAHGIPIVTFEAIYSKLSPTNAEATSAR